MTEAIEQADGAGAPETETVVNFRETLSVLYDKVLVRRSEPVLMSKGGIHMAETHVGRPAEGYVVLVGEGRLMRDGTIIPLRLKHGDRVLFGKFSGSATEMDTPGGALIALREDEILAYWRAEAIEPPAFAPTEG